MRNANRAKGEKAPFGNPKKTKMVKLTFMALARLSVKVGKKGKASAHAKYIAREDKYAKNPDIEKLEFTGHGNMPSWAEKDPNIFWQTADEFERKNGSAYREHIISLPRELTPEQNHEFLKDWIAQEIGDKHVYQYAIHNPKALDGKEQPHAHLMFSERTLDNIERAPDQFFKRYNSKEPSKGGAKKANTGLKPAQRRAELKDQRQRFEDTYNKHLAKAGLNIRVSMKSFADRNFTTKPINFSMTEFKKGSDRVDAYKRSLELRSEIPELMQQARQQQAEIERQRAEQARQVEIERQRAEQARQAEIERQRADIERQARIKQLETHQAIAKMTPFKLLKITVKTEVKGFNARRLTGELQLGSALGEVLRAKNSGQEVRIYPSDNQHLANSQTAQKIKDFMYENIADIDVLVDYGELNIKQFTDKYSIDCDFKDLEQLYEPPEQQHAPSQQHRASAKENNNDLDLDF